MAAIKPQFPFIQINEVLLKENGQWLHFARPHRIIQADELKDVIPALRELEALIEANQWHAAGFLSYEAAPAFDKTLFVVKTPDAGSSTTAPSGSTTSGSTTPQQ